MLCLLGNVYTISHILNDDYKLMCDTYMKENLFKKVFKVTPR